MKLTREQRIKTADEMLDSIKNWKVIDQKGEFFAFRLPPPSANSESPAEGEVMRCWRFNTRFAAERFRNLKIIEEMSVFKETAAA